jgi:site-specific DNA recombinase
MARRSRTRPAPIDPAADRRAVVYCRVSTDEQARSGTSLPAQAMHTQAYAEREGLEVVAVVRDEGVSGTVPFSKRPGGADVLRLMAERAVAHVLVVAQDRISRDNVDGTTVLRAWEAEGFAVHAVHEGGRMDLSTASGKLTTGLRGIVAEDFRNQIAQKTRAALGYKKSKGEAVSRAPRGCRIEDKRLVADPASDGLALFNRARELRASGLAYQAVADQLMAEGFKGERGGRLYPSTIHYVINNERLAAAAAAGVAA